MTSVLSWFRLSPPAAVSSRWISLDLETSGLDPKRDRIVEIGAVAMHNGRVDLADHFQRLNTESTGLTVANRVLHGVTAAEQRDGTPLALALDDLLAWMRDAPLVGFHTTFDIGFLRAALMPHLGSKAAAQFGVNYLDLAVIAPIVFPQLKARGLGEWTAALHLPIRKQHRAMADALATAHLLQRIIAARPAAERNFDALKLIESGRRWL
jgi:DNA polymerase III subunit epsilon